MSNTNEVNFTISPEDARIIDAITKRAQAEHERAHDKPLAGAIGLTMDLSALQANANPPYDLARLLESHSVDFWHDVSGIRQSIDRETGKLQDLFEPRFGRRSGLATIVPTYTVTANALEVDRALEALATHKDSNVWHRVREDGMLRVYDGQNTTMFSIAPAAFGYLIARGWVRHNPGTAAWSITDAGAVEYSSRRLDHEEARAEAQADRDHNI